MPPIVPRRFGRGSNRARRARRSARTGRPACARTRPARLGPGSRAGTAEPYGTGARPDRCLITHRSPALLLILEHGTCRDLKVTDLDMLAGWSTGDSSAVPTS